MSDLLQQAGNILSQAQEWLQNPDIKSTVTGFLSWMGEKVFGGKKSAQEKLVLIEQQKADAATIDQLKATLEFALEDNETLQQELTSRIAALNEQLKVAGINVTQTHSGTGDNVAGDKIGKQINMGDNSTYNETNH